MALKYWLPKMSISAVFCLLALPALGKFDFSRFPVLEPLNPGQCQGILASKEYLNYKPGTLVRFTCDYKCLDNDGTAHLVTAESSAFADGGESEMFKMVCEGAVVAKVDGYFTVTQVKSFWAKLSPFPEIRKWQRDHNVKISAEHEAFLTTKMLQDFRLQSEAYMKPNLPNYFNEAGEILKIFSENTEAGRQLLTEWITKIDAGYRPKYGRDAIIFGSILGSARFLLRDSGI